MRQSPQRPALFPHACLPIQLVLNYSVVLYRPSNAKKMSQLDPQTTRNNSYRRELIAKLGTPKGRIFAGVSLALIVTLVTLVVVVSTGRNPSDKPNARPAANTADQLTRQPRFKGIIVGSTKQVRSGDSLGDQWILTAYSPNEGTTTTRTFTAGIYNAAFSWSEVSTEPPDGIIARQLFSADYTKMAVHDSKSDGSSNIGYIDEAGVFTNLTPQTSDYSGASEQTAAIFNPATGRIWFDAPTKLGSVDPDKGVGSSQTEPFATAGQETGAGQHIISSFYFSPAGDKPLYKETGEYSAYSPDGKNRVDYCGDSIWAGCTGGFKINGDKLIPFPTGDKSCYLRRFISNTEFLCLGSNDTQLYKISITGGTAVALLPASERKVSDAVANPSGKQVAFIAKAGNVKTLYVINSSGGQPQKVADIGQGDFHSPALLSWEQ